MFDIPPGVILPVSRITVRLDDAPHPYELENRAAIDANWAAERARQPRLFDGEMILLASAGYHDGRIEGRCHPIRFATFLHWRKNRDASAGYHVFASAMPVTADGALLAVRMGPHTANAGRVYFAAGSFERQDFSGGLVDVDHNIRREVAEETGFDLAGVPHERHYHALCTTAGLTLVRRYCLGVDAETAAARVRTHIAGETEPEVDEAVIIRAEADVPESAPPHMKPLVRWHFSGEAAPLPEA